MVIWKMKSCTEVKRQLVLISFGWIKNKSKIKRKIKKKQSEGVVIMNLLEWVIYIQVRK